MYGQRTRHSRRHRTHHFLDPQGGEITVADLVAKGAVRNGFPVKVLGDGEVSAAYTLKGVKASASAKSKIEAAGGSISED